MAPYLARLSAEWIAAEPDVLCRTIEGTVAFLDVSGFTRLSEQLSKRGKVGAEELTDVITSCFTALLDLATAHGGMLIKFGGDALLMLFEGPGHAARACAAAYEMRRELRDVGRVRLPGGRVSLKMSVGIHSGAFEFFFVGGSHRELMIAGRDATTTVQMEGAATAGEILVSKATAALLPPGCTSGDRAGGTFLERMPAATGVIDLREGNSPSATHAELLECVPVALRENIASSLHEPEHRRATVAFIHFDGTDELISEKGADKAAEVLDSLVRIVQESAERYDVALLGTDVDADGGKLILSAGVPSTFGEDEERMLRAVRAVIDSAPPIAVRIGVNRGDVFAGDVGPPTRRTYTVMGDTVNLAARIMAKAQPGQILASRSVVDRCGAFETTPLEPFMVKGKSQPVEAFAVGAAAAPRSDLVGAPLLPLVGRAAELERLGAMADSLGAGGGSVAELVAEAGLGKTRLLQELRSQARAACPGLREYRAFCEAYESSTPYAALAPLVRMLLGIDDPGPAVPTVERLRLALRDADPGLEPWAPLFSPLLGVEISDTPETAALDHRFRAERLGLAIAELVVRSVTRPTLVTIEDTHWMDEASADLLAKLATAVHEIPLLVCTTRRPVDTGYKAEPEQSLRLTGLSDQEATRLVELATEADPLAPHATAALVGRSGGNPLFLTELLAAASTEDESLPDSVEALITARIDRLSHDDRHVLRHASVLGNTFPVDWLEALVGHIPDHARSRLSGFVRFDTEGMVAFEHALIRDAAYEGLPFKARRNLHRAVAEMILSSAAATAEERAGLLSLHYLHADDFQEAWRYSLLAADRARSIYANVEAAELYERALLAATRLNELAPDEVAGVQEALGDSRQRFGEYGLAEGAYRSARRRMKGDPLAEARLLQKIASSQAWVDDHTRALKTLRGAMKLIAGDESEEACRQRARLLSAIASSCAMDGRHRAAVRWCRVAIEAADSYGETAALGDALRWLDWTLSQTGSLERPDNLLRAVELYRELDDPAGQAIALNMLGAISYWRGDWTMALDSYDTARQAATRSGNTVMEAMFSANIAEILVAQGRHGDVEPLLGRASRVSRASGTRSGNSFAMVMLGRVAAIQGDHDRAMELLDGAIALADESHAVDEAVEGRARKAEALLFSGAVGDALALAEATLQDAAALGGAPQEPLLHRVRAAALARTGDTAAADEALAASLAAARERAADYEIALTLAAEADMARMSGAVASPAAQQASRQILDRLGVVEVPSLFG